MELFFTDIDYLVTINIAITILLAVKLLFTDNLSGLGIGKKFLLTLLFFISVSEFRFLVNTYAVNSNVFISIENILLGIGLGILIFFIFDKYFPKIKKWYLIALIIPSTIVFMLFSLSIINILLLVLIVLTYIGFRILRIRYQISDLIKGKRNLNKKLFLLQNLPHLLLTIFMICTIISSILLYQLPNGISDSNNYLIITITKVILISITALTVWINFHFFEQNHILGKSLRYYSIFFPIIIGLLVITNWVFMQNILSNEKQKIEIEAEQNVFFASRIVRANEVTAINTTIEGITNPLYINLKSDLIKINDFLKTFDGLFVIKLSENKLVYIASTENLYSVSKISKLYSPPYPGDKYEIVNFSDLINIRPNEIFKTREKKNNIYITNLSLENGDKYYFGGTQNTENWDIQLLPTKIALELAFILVVTIFSSIFGLILREANQSFNFEQNYKKYKATISNSESAQFILSLQGKIEEANEACLDLLQIKQMPPGMFLTTLMPEFQKYKRDSKKVMKQLLQSLKQKEELKTHLRFNTINNKSVDLEAHFSIYITDTTETKVVLRLIALDK